MSSYCPTLVVAAWLVFFGVVSPAWADRPASGNGPAIKAKIDDVVAKTTTLTENLSVLCNADCESTTAGRRLKSRIDRVKRAHDRVRATHGRAHAEDFQALVRRRGHKKSDAPCDPEFQVCLDLAPAVTLADPLDTRRSTRSAGRT